MQLLVEPYIYIYILSLVNTNTNTNHKRNKSPILKTITHRTFPPNTDIPYQTQIQIQKQDKDQTQKQQIQLIQHRTPTHSNAPKRPNPRLDTGIPARWRDSTS